MSNDKMRDEFEAFAFRDASECCVDLSFQFDPEINWYIGKSSEHMNLAWAAWQASREALVIELPQSRADKGESANGDGGCLSALIANQLAIDECRRAIEAAGLKVSS
jgi:hypothetical protein